MTRGDIARRATLAERMIFIIGGWLGSGPLAASDMYVLHIDTMSWEEPPVEGQPPGPCNMHSADYIPHLRQVLVFRGGDGREYLNDLHALDIDTYRWEEVEVVGSAPSAARQSRVRPSLASDSSFLADGTARND